MGPLKLMLMSVTWWSLLAGGVSSVLKDITQEVFGENKKLVPVAFGDFNSDKLTDVVVLNQDRNWVGVLVSDSNMFPVPEMYFKAKLKPGDKKGIECYINDANVQSVIPGDFDGDGGMDLLAVLKSFDQEQRGGLFATVLWGDHDGEQHKLVCPGSKPKWDHRIPMALQPILLHADADETADLFGARPSNSTQERGIWLFANRDSEPKFVPLPGKENVPLRKVHSNAYVDVDGDGNSDLFLVAEDRFEVWTANGNDSLFSHWRDIVVPDCGKTCRVGQLAFVDIDMDANIEILMPVCYDGVPCNNATLLMATMEDIRKGSKAPFKAVQTYLGNWKFDMTDDDDGLFAPLSLRTGDFNLDGYPDLLLRLKQPLLPDSVHQTHMFVNLELDDEDIAPQPPAGTRSFRLEESVMRDIKYTHAAAFFDLYEDGTEDLIVVREVQGQLEVGAYTNRTKGSDAYFVKVIALTGACYQNCPGGHVNVPYGTNSPGRTICYHSHRPTDYHQSTPIASCAPQLTQTAFSPLQLPYTIFGLGVSPNFVESLNVNVSNTKAEAPQRHHRWTQIIPNSQMYVIPFPTDKSEDWKLKLFITPSKSIIYTALVLLGLCFITVIAILFLHWRERVADRREKLQEANRFHFDAM